MAGGGYIYVASVDGVVAKINYLDAPSGELIWKQHVGWVWVSDGLAFIPGVDGYVNCLDAESEHIVWCYRTEHSTCSEPLVIGNHVFFGGWAPYLYKLDKRSGGTGLKISAE